MGLLCFLIGHRRRGDKVWHDMVDWRSSCSRCAQPLIRDHQLDRWRAFTTFDVSDVRKERERL